MGAGRWGCGENGGGWEVGWLTLVVHCQASILILTWNVLEVPEGSESLVRRSWSLIWGYTVSSFFQKRVIDFHSSMGLSFSVLEKPPDRSFNY